MSVRFPAVCDIVNVRFCLAAAGYTSGWQTAAQRRLIPGCSRIYVRLADRCSKAAHAWLRHNNRLDSMFRNMSGKRHPGRRISSSSTSRGGETFSFFCDSGEQLEILNFLPHIQDLGLTVCRCRKRGSPKRCLPEPLHKACCNARASGTGPSADTAWKQKI